MISRVLPYLPSPRPAAPELGRRSTAPPVARAVSMFAHLAGIFLFVAVPAAFAWFALHCLFAMEWSMLWRAVGFIVFMPIALVYLKSLLPRRLPISPGVIPMNPDNEPTPHAFVARVAEEVGSPVPRRLWIGSGTELGLRGRRSLHDLLRRGRTEVEIGLWLWHGLTLSEFQAIIARTLAPLARGRLEQVRYTARAILESLILGQDLIDEMAETDTPFAFLTRMTRGAHTVAVYPLRVVAGVLLRLGTVRNDALDDDLAAVRIAGSDALVHAILRADFAAAALRAIERELDDAARVGVFTRDLYAHVSDATTLLRETHNDFMLGEPPTLRGPNAGKYADVFEPGQLYLSRMWSTMPLPAEREQVAKRIFVPCERDDRPAYELLDDPKHLRERLTWLRYTEELGREDDFIPLAPEKIVRWLRTQNRIEFPARYSGVYDSGRPIEPGDPQERHRALVSESWNDVRLATSAAGLYGNADERAARWRSVRAGLDKALRRTIFRSSARDRAIAEDLEDDFRKVRRWLAALDRWAFIIHVHMAARLPSLSLHDALLRRYESVLRLAPIAADAREYRNRVAAFTRLLGEYDGLAPYPLQRDAAYEFRASRKDLAYFLKESSAISDPLLREWTGEIPLDQFLYSHKEQVFRARLPLTAGGRQLLHAWDEVVAKAEWLYTLSLKALLELHEQIEEQFLAHVGPSILADETVPEAVVIDSEEETALEIEVKPENKA